MTREQAIQKAIKLLRLAEGNADANESASAAAAAQAILDKYEIERAMLDTDGDAPDPVDSEPIGDRGSLDEWSRMVNWKARLAAIIAEFNGCDTFLRRNSYRRHASVELVGRPSDAQTVRYLYAALVGEVDRLTRINARGMGRGYANAYRHGVVDSIRDAFRRRRRETIDEARAAAPDSQALVRVDDAANKLVQRAAMASDWMRNAHRLGRGRAWSYTSTAGRAAGRVDGRSVSVGGARGGLNAPAKRVKA